MEHRGQLVKDAVTKSGIDISEIAHRMDMSRTSVYNWFEMPNLSIERVMRIGRAINHDFSADIPEIKKMARMYIASVSPSLSFDENLEDYRTTVSELEKCRNENQQLKDELLSLHRKVTALTEKVEAQSH